MATRDVRTQAELDQAVKDKVTWINIRGDAELEVTGSSTVTACDSSTVRAYGSSTVTAYGSSTVRAYGSSTVRAYGSSTVRAYGSSTVRAYGSSTVRAYDSSTVTASALVPVQVYSDDAKVTASIVVPIRTPATMVEWCEFYGVKVSRGWATVFKAVDADLKSGYSFAYPIGEEVAAPDWSPAERCGGGLHFSPRPFMALAYAPGAARFLAVRVKVSECVLLGDKIKAPRCKVTGEVNEDGDALAEAAA